MSEWILGLIESEYHADPDFYVSYWEELTKSSSFFGFQKPAQKGAITSTGTPSRMCVSTAFWRYTYLGTFSGADTGISGIQGVWYYGIHADYGWLVDLASHTSGGGQYIYDPS